MPTCPQCDNRLFSNKEALQQHMKTSSAWHPTCSLCDRRFSSEAALDSHVAVKHPPTYDCRTCNRSYHAVFALDDHYRGSVAHPNCVRCGRGFIDQAACDEHHREVHPKIPCTKCGGIALYEDDLDKHFWDSHNHPSCVICHRGFKDNESYRVHFPVSHPDIHCAPCEATFETPEGLQNHFLTSLAHPRCELCNLGFLDHESKGLHLEGVHTPETPRPIKEPVVVDVPSSVEGPLIEEVLKPSSPEESVIQPSPFKNSFMLPSLHEEPKSEVALYNTGFTPLSPRHRIQRLLIGENRTDSPDLRLEVAFASPLTEVQPLFSPASLPRPADNIERFWNSRENIQITTSRIFPPVPQRIETYIHREPGPSRSAGAPSTWFDPTRPSFRPRFTSPQISPPIISPPRTSTEFNSRLYPGSVRHAMRTASLNRPTPPTGLNFGANGHRSFGSEGGNYVRSGGSTASDQISWKELMGNGPQDRASLFSETLTPTPKAHNLTTSPSMATISSPASSTLDQSPVSIHNEPDTRPTTASSSKTPLFSYKITPTSECTSPRSPEVGSPADLSALPMISPLASTPLDLLTFDIPEAYKPLPESPVDTPSPVTVVLDFKPQEQQAPILSHSPQSTSSSRSYITSPQELSDTTLTSTISSPLTPTVPAPGTKSNPLHCRVCLTDTCDDITASMCGHIFCNRCITDAVIKTNRCPVCMTPTLLYCLFRLDLGA